MTPYDIHVLCMEKGIKQMEEAGNYYIYISDHEFQFGAIGDMPTNYIVNFDDDGGHCSQSVKDMQDFFVALSSGETCEDCIDCSCGGYVSQEIAEDPFEPSRDLACDTSNCD